MSDYRSGYDFRKLPDGTWQRKPIGHTQWATLTLVDKTVVRKGRRKNSEHAGKQWVWT